MDRQVPSQWLRKEFRIPRDALKVGLFLSIVANVGLFLIALHFADKSLVRGFQAEWLAASIGFELAKKDISSGEPRFLTIEYVDSGARGTSLIEKTTETRDGLSVWQWRCVKPRGDEQLPYLELFIDEYNKEVASDRPALR